MLVAVHLHLVVDGAGDDVARRELGVADGSGHERLAVRPPQDRPLAAQRLADQERLRLRVVQAGRVELDELHVADRHAGAVGHGDAVAGRDVGVGRVEVHLAGAAGGQQRRARAEALHRAGRPDRARRRPSRTASGSRGRASRR